MYVHTSCITAFISTLSLMSEDTTWVSPSNIAFIILSHSSCSKDTSINKFQKMYTIVTNSQRILCTFFLIYVAVCTNNQLTME